MASADDSFPQLGVCRTRVAALNAAGLVAGGATMYVSDALLKATIKPNYEDGDEIKEKNGCGDIYVDFKGSDSLLWYDVELEFLSPDPYLAALLVPTSDIITLAGGRVGWAAPAIGAQTSNGVSVELFTKRAKGGALSQTFPYANHALPLFQNARFGDRTLDSGAQHVIVSGQAVENANWFDGPANDWPADDGGGGYLTRAWKWVPRTTIPAPSPAGYATATAS